MGPLDRRDDDLLRRFADGDDDLAHVVHVGQVADGAARGQAATARRSRWPRSLMRAAPVALAVAVTLAVVVGALGLLHRGGGSSTPGGGNPGGLPVIGSRQARRDLKDIRTATALTLRSAVCRRRGAQPPAVIHGTPSAALLSTLGVLRRPAAARDRMPGHALDGVNGVYAGAARRARTIGGTTYYLVPVRQYPDAGQPTAACLDAQLAAVHRALPSFPASDRASVWALESRLVASDRRTISGAPSDVVCFVTHGIRNGGQSCGITVSSIRENGGGIDGAGPINGAGQTDSGIVPDGVASVTLRLPASRGRPAVTRTGRVVGNVWVIDVPAERPDTQPTVVWHAADGHVVHTIAPPSRADMLAACRHDVACLALQGARPSEGSSQASSSSASATTASRMTRAPSARAASSHYQR